MPTDPITTLAFTQLGLGFVMMYLLSPQEWMRLISKWLFMLIVLVIAMEYYFTNPADLVVQGLLVGVVIVFVALFAFEFIMLAPLAFQAVYKKFKR